MRSIILTKTLIVFSFVRALFASMVGEGPRPRTFFGVVFFAIYFRPGPDCLSSIR